jgi:hypothetical protein
VNDEDFTMPTLTQQQMAQINRKSQERIRKREQQFMREEQQKRQKMKDEEAVYQLNRLARLRPTQGLNAAAVQAMARPSNYSVTSGSAANNRDQFDKLRLRLPGQSSGTDYSEIWKKEQMRRGTVPVVQPRVASRQEGRFPTRWDFETGQAFFQTPAPVRRVPPAVAPRPPKLSN